MSPMVDIQRRHAEVFRLRFGDKSDKGAPRKLTDSIRVTSKSAAVVQAFVDVYDGDCHQWEDGHEAYLPISEIPIMVLPGQSITQWWELYKGSVCERRCDGMTETITGHGCLCAADITERMQAKGQCRPMTRVNVLCPEVAVVGAGSFVSHGLIAAETLPQSVAVAEAALNRGLMVPGVLRSVEHKSKKHYVVPQIEIVGVSLAALATGEVPRQIDAPTPRAALESGGGAASPCEPGASGGPDRPPATAVSGTSPPPAEDLPPFPEDDTPDVALATNDEVAEITDWIALLDEPTVTVVKERWKDAVGMTIKARERFTHDHYEKAISLLETVVKERILA